MDYVLRIMKPDGSVDRVPLSGDRLSIGRARVNDLSFPEESTLSREHIELNRHDSGWTVRDLGTRNGTTLNGEPVTQETPLRAGDVIRAGRTVIAVEVRIFDATQAESTLQAALSHPGEQSAAMNLLVRACRKLVNPGPAGWFSFILSEAMETLEADRGVLMMLENGQLVTRASIGPDFPVSSTILDRVMRERLSLVAADVDADEQLQAAESLIFQGVRSLIAVPLQSEHEIHGVLYLHKTRPRHFGVEDLNLVTVLAHMAAIRREQEILAERERVEREEKDRMEQLADSRRRALEAAELLRHAETRAVLAESAASIGRLAAAVSHEINTPLGALKSSVETLSRVAEKSRSAIDPARFFQIADDLCQSISASADRLNAILARLRRVTNLDRAEVQQIDLHSLLADIAQLASRGNSELFRLDLPELPPIVSRPQVISAVFTAVLEYCIPEPAIITGVRDGDMIRVHIQQAGRVLPEDELLQLFEPSFRSIDGRVSSDNWGLFSARHLIRELSGELYAESSPERGTVFTAMLRYDRS